MDTNRRKFLQTGLWGAGAVGLRALATGLPAAYFLNPDQALADTPPPACATAAGRAQYLILSIDQNGDPINANAPGTYDDPGIVHPTPADGSFAKTPIKLGSQTVNGPAIWGTLPQWVLDRTTFFHLATQTTIHPDLPKVLSLMGASAGQEMLPSIVANNLASCLGTVQPAPVSLLGAQAPEYVTYQGRVLPNMNAVALKNILTHQMGPLTNLMQLRDQSMDKLWARLKTSANPGQKAFIDNLAQSRQQARTISDQLLSNLGTITTNDASGQALAAAALIKMNVTPVVVIRIPFGGDNHFDQNLTTEAEQAASSTPVNGAMVVNMGVPLIGALMTNLQNLGLADQVTFASLNVFGRTLKSLGTVGRNHWADHQVSLLIGPKVKPGVVGGVQFASTKGDYMALPIDSASGMGTPNGDLKEGDLLGSFGKTLCAAVGVPQTVTDQVIAKGKVVAGAVSG